METITVASEFRRQLALLFNAQEQGLEQSLVNSQAAVWPALRKGVEAGRKESQKNFERLKQVFGILGLEQKSSLDLGMQGILEENNASLAAAADPVQRDLVILASAQTAVRYYVGRYKLLRVYAETLGYDDAVKLLTRSIKSISRSDTLIDLQDRYLLKHGPGHELGAARVMLWCFGVLGLTAIGGLFISRLEVSRRSE